MNKDYFKIALKNLKVRPLRSWLTILGIIIGIFLVVSLLSLSEGLKESVMKELRMMGSDLIMVLPGEDFMMSFVGGNELSDMDIKAIEKTRGVEDVVVMPWSVEIVRNIDEAKSVMITGVSFERASKILKEDMGWDTVDGYFPRPGKREVLIGNIVSREIFPQMIVGNEIMINGKRFIVSGILRSLGNKQDDSMIIMDLDDFRSVTGKREGTPIAMVKVGYGYNVNSIVENIEDSLKETRKRVSGSDSKPFSVIASDTVSDMVEGVMGTIQTAILAFASIAILVGGIGIMNTMFTSVTERTKEIGILKAIGAKKNDITMIFLFESGIIGLIGGFGGTLLGILLSKGVELILRYSGDFFVLEAHVSPFLIFFGLFFSFLIGCLSGYFPAKKAAKLTPVDALRYE